MYLSIRAKRSLSWYNPNSLMVSGVWPFRVSIVFFSNFPPNFDCNGVCSSSNEFKFLCITSKILMISPTGTAKDECFSYKSRWWNRSNAALIRLSSCSYTFCTFLRFLDSFWQIGQCTPSKKVYKEKKQGSWEVSVVGEKKGRRIQRWMNFTFVLEMRDLMAQIRHIVWRHSQLSWTTSFV